MLPAKPFDVKPMLSLVAAVVVSFGLFAANLATLLDNPADTNFPVKELSSPRFADSSEARSLRGLQPLATLGVSPDSFSPSIGSSVGRSLLNNLRTRFVFSGELQLADLNFWPSSVLFSEFFPLAGSARPAPQLLNRVKGRASAAFSAEPQPEQRQQARLNALNRSLSSVGVVAIAASRLQAVSIPLVGGEVLDRARFEPVALAAALNHPFDNAQTPEPVCLGKP